MSDQDIPLLVEPYCPCRGRRSLEDANDPVVLWEVLYSTFVLVIMFGLLVTDRVGSDCVMLLCLTLYLVAGIITLSEAFVGFSNTGVLTVMVLFIIADGLSKTGALDWYMGKLLGKPKAAASAQTRLMIPVAILSAFLNNTPIVVVMIPIVLKWARSINVSVQQLLMPLSFATILGGTCTLIGTSTNLVVAGLLEDNYGDSVSIGLFDVGLYGVPNALAGLAYILLMSPFLLPGGRRKSNQASPIDTNDDDMLFGARLTHWSPAAGRSVQRSGLRDTGGIYLVSVRRATTGHVHRAVSNDFVLNAGDILYFTGMVESFGEFCAEHGLEVVTNEMEGPIHGQGTDDTLSHGSGKDLVPGEVGVTKQSLLQADETERLRSLSVMADLIRGFEPPSDYNDLDVSMPHKLGKDDPATVVVAIEKDLVVVGVSAPDRPGLLLDISKGLVRLSLQLKHTEAAVVDGRSLSIWRCDVMGADNDRIPLPDLEEIWSVLNALLANEGGVEAVKERGLKVIRARVTKESRLVSKTATDVDFRKTYRAAIVAVQGNDASSGKVDNLSSRVFNEGDVLILQASDDSPLLIRPPADFYIPQKEMSALRKSSMRDMVSRLSMRATSSAPPSSDMDVELASAPVDEEEMVNAWKDLQVLFHEEDNDGHVTAMKEFLTAMQVAPKAKWIGKNVRQIGIEKLPDLFLVSIERPVQGGGENSAVPSPKRARLFAFPAADNISAGDASVQTEAKIFNAVDRDEPLQAGDVLWFSGPASAVGDLRKIPGLESYENKVVKNMNEKVYDRRLVQAVISRNGPLVGKTVKEVRFGSRYGAAVIAVHRDGKRVHEHPGKVKLHAGDVLLLEAGPTFMARSSENDPSFALLAEVEDSAPPRFWMLIPALVITVAMLAVAVARVTTLLVSGLCAAILFVGIGVLTEQEARNSVNWAVYVTIACAFGIGQALVNSGIAGGVANFLVGIGTALGIGDAGILGAVYFATFLISSVVTNNAAAALIFPVAMKAAEQSGTSLTLMSFALMLGASASFMTPYGYQTNLLIYGPGGYKYKDFLVFGIPMQIFLWILATAFLVIRPYWISWLATAFFLILVVVIRVWSASMPFGCGKDVAEKTN